MSHQNLIADRKPKTAFSDFDFFRIVVDFIGDLAGSLNAVLTFVQNLLNFLA
jgi:hypothetical protein